MSPMLLSGLILSLLASTPVELGDLEPATFNRGSNPTLGAELNGSAYFFVDDPDPSNRSLWRTDGTAPGTVRVARLPPGIDAVALVAATNRLFAISLEPLTGVNTLWTSDGVSTLDAVSNIPHYAPLRNNLGTDPMFVAAGTNVVFAVDSPLTLWGSDGTPAGTVNLGIAMDTTFQGLLRTFGDRAVAVGGTLHGQVFSTDGTLAGTVLVFSTPAIYSPIGIELGYAWFSSDKLTSWDGGFPVELRDAGTNYTYRPHSSAHGLFYYTRGSAPRSSDGTSIGSFNCSLPAAEPVSMLGVGNNLYIQNEYPGGSLIVYDGGSCIENSIGGNYTTRKLTKVGTHAFFTMDTSATGDEPAISEGASGLPEVLHDIRPGTASSSPVVLTTLGPTVLFSADDGLIGRELYSSDGTSAGTGLVADVNSAIAGYGSTPAEFTTLPDGVAFTAWTLGGGRQVWTTDGGTPTPITALPTEVDGGLVLLGGNLYFAGDSTVYRSSPGVDGGAAIVGSFPYSEVGNLTPAGGALFFTVDTTLWRSNGTPGSAVQVRPLSDTPSGKLLPVGSHVLTVEWPALHSDDGSVHEILAADISANPVLGPDGRAWYGRANGQIWSTDGTLAGSRQEAKLVAPATALAHTAGTTIAFGSTDAGTQLWRLGTDGGAVSVTSFGTATVQELAPLSSFALFTVGDAYSRKLWSTDGTNVFPLSLRADGGGRATDLSAAGGLVYFAADDGVTGVEPWRTDGTQAGTGPIADLEPGPGNSSPARFHLSGDLLAFAASTTAHGEEPWAVRVDPTPPVITVSPPDTTGWFRNDVDVTFTVSDPNSAITRTIGCDGGSVVSDTAGQVFDCSAASAGGFTHAQVTVRRDSTAPTLTCPADVTVQVLTPTSVVSYPDASATDNLDPSPAITYSPPRDQPLAAPGGTVNVTATDQAGNSGTCAFAVHLSSGATPTVSCLQSVVREPADANGLTLAAYPPEAATGNDPVDGAQVQLEFDPPPGGTFAPESTTPVTVTAINSGGQRSAPCTFNLSIACTTDACRARLAAATRRRSQYDFGCSSTGGAFDLAPVAFLLVGFIRRRRR